MTLGSPLNICQMIRRNGDHKATKLFIGLRHPFTARIQVLNVHNSLIVYTHTLSLHFYLSETSLNSFNFDMKEAQELQLHIMSKSYFHKFIIKEQKVYFL